jgi:hypothetical protein
MVTLGTFMTRTGGRRPSCRSGADRFELSAGGLGVLFTLMSLLNLAAVPRGTLATAGVARR